MGAEGYHKSLLNAGLLLTPRFQTPPNTSQEALQEKGTLGAPLHPLMSERGATSTPRTSGTESPGRT